jgi:TPR repeat protein
LCGDTLFRKKFKKKEKMTLITPLGGVSPPQSSHPLPPSGTGSETINRVNEAVTGSGILSQDSERMLKTLSWEGSKRAVIRLLSKKGTEGATSLALEVLGIMEDRFSTDICKSEILYMKARIALADFGGYKDLEKGIQLLERIPKNTEGPWKKKLEDIRKESESIKDFKLEVIFNKIKAKWPINGNEMGYLSKKADSGNAKAKYYFAAHLIDNQHEINRSLKFFESAYNDGIKESAHQIGKIYSTDRYGKFNIKTAIHWFEKGIDQGDVNSGIQLLRVYNVYKDKANPQKIEALLDKMVNFILNSKDKKKRSLNFLKIAFFYSFLCTETSIEKSIDILEDLKRDNLLSFGYYLFYKIFNGGFLHQKFNSYRDYEKAAAVFDLYRDDEKAAAVIKGLSKAEVRSYEETFKRCCIYCQTLGSVS